MTDQEHRDVTDLLAAHDALIHWCETLITPHADLVELASDADLRISWTLTSTSSG